MKRCPDYDRPEYCSPDLQEDEDCPLCGATPDGTCAAKHPWPKVDDVYPTVVLKRKDQA